MQVKYILLQVDFLTLYIYITSLSFNLILERQNVTFFFACSFTLVSIRVVEMRGNLNFISLVEAYFSQ